MNETPAHLRGRIATQQLEVVRCPTELRCGACRRGVAEGSAHQMATPSWGNPVLSWECPCGAFVVSECVRKGG